ncbi:MAG: DUF1624 domain-containing protein [Rhizobiaceae bacterium]|nr:DUF1624 domain-containing protein [Rhizobiaceae bacterium]
MRAPPPRTPRVDGLDVARGLALLAMASYHFTWDLEFFGYIEPGTTAQGLWKLYARAIASTFLLLAGVSLALAHGNGIRWQAFWRRFVMVAAAAAAISAATYLAVPNGFIFFGILHQIALGSLLGLVFLRLPPLIILAAALVVIGAPHFLKSPMFDHPWLWWLGLAPINPRSNDYVPVFPWFGVVLVGIGLARSFQQAGLIARLAAIRARDWTKPFRFAGRHSLAVYLIHQPVLIGLVWLFAQIWPAPMVTEQARFTVSCESRCAETQNETFCKRYCGCMLQRIEDAGLLAPIFSGTASEELNSRIGDLALSCSAEIEGLEDSPP